MVEPVKLTAMWFCLHCIKQVKAASAVNENDEDDDFSRPPDAENAEERKKNNYNEIIKQAPKVLIIDIEL